METNDLLRLLVAAQLRSLAITLRAEAAQRNTSTSDGMAAYMAQHPVAEFVPAALELLRAVADLMPAGLAPRTPPTAPATP